jgi:hypothetical protein
MLVYANHLTFEGADAEQAVLKGIGGWLKEQLGFGLHPDQLKEDGEFTGHRGEQRSWLRVFGCYEGEPALCAWVLKHAAEGVRGRQWIVEVGVKKFGGVLEMSCVVKTDEHSTLVAAPVSASQPRVIRYVVNNVLATKDASFAGVVPGEVLRSVGEDTDSYRAFLAEIERRGRNGAIVLVSATREGEYLVNPAELQKTLIGLAQVVQVTRESNSYEMSEILGKQQSAWGGVINVLSMPSASGVVRFRYFLPDAIRAWGEEPQRISQVLAWVTGDTNLARLRMHVRPEGVAQLSMRRRMDKVRAKSAQMDTAQLRQALDEASKQAVEQEKFFNELVEENAGLEGEVSRFKDELEDTRDELRKQEFQLQALKDQLSRAGDAGSGDVDAEALLKLAAQKDEPSPLQCLDVIQQAYGDRCVILESARTSAKRMSRFECGRELLDLLIRLVTSYRDALKDGGDSKARGVFGKNEYAAKESEGVMASPALRRRRTFAYDGEDVEMFRHIKMGIDDDVTSTIRVHFHWDGERERVVIGYCGEHLPVVGR